MNFFKYNVSYILVFLSLLNLLAGPLEAKPKLLKLASLAPEGSSWITALRAIDAELREKTDQAVGFKIYPGGVQGDEDVMMRKIRVGQLHGGVFAALGLSQLNPEILTVQMPFLFETYAEVDYVLDQMKAFYKQGYAANGYTLLGLVDIGFVHILSQQPIHNIEDLKGVKVWQMENEPITAAIFDKVGVQSVPLPLPDVLLGLQTNLIEMVYAPPSAAIALQWFTRVNYRIALPINYTVGALLISTKKISSLSLEHQTLLEEITQRHTKALSTQIRLENQQALEVMQDQGITVIDPLPDAIETFRLQVQKAQGDLVGKAFTQEAFDLVLKHLATYHAQVDTSK